MTQITTVSTLGGDSSADSNFFSSELLADVILKKNLLRVSGGKTPSFRELENIRDPNKLARLILPFSKLATYRVEFSYKVLEKILKEVNQEKYKPEYEAALNNAIQYYGNRSDEELFNDMPSDKIWRPYNTVNLDQSLNGLNNVWNPGPRLLDVDQFKLTKIGHGISVTHSERKEFLEYQGLQQAIEIINEVLKTGGRLDEKTLCIIHTLIASETSAYNQILDLTRPINLGYRSQGAFRDLLMFPPFPEEFSDLAERYGIEALPPASISPLLKLLPSSSAANEELLEQSVPYRAASDKLASSPTGKLTLQNRYGDPILHRLMRKYFLWQNKVLNETDLTYNSDAVKSKKTSPSNGRFEHPAVIIAAQAFNRLFYIHPFENGNTRVSSFAIANNILSKYGYPPFILTNQNEAEFYGIHRFARFPLELFEDTSSHDVAKWERINDADRQLAAFFADEIIKK